MTANKFGHSSQRLRFDEKASRSFLPKDCEFVPCAIYARSATERDPNPEKHAVMIQQQHCLRAIWQKQSEGWVHRVTLSDPNCSGASPNRLGLQLLLSLVRTRKIKVVVVYARDRLARGIELCAGIHADLARHGVKVYSCVEGMGGDGPVDLFYQALQRASDAHENASERSAPGRRTLRARKAKETHRPKTF